MAGEAKTNAFLLSTATVMLGAPKWRGGSGGPTRVVALV